MNALDLAVAAVLLISAVLAFFRGFVHEILGITAWVGAALAALHGTPVLAPRFTEMTGHAWMGMGIAGAVLFLGTLLVLSLITRAVSKRVQESALTSVDRSLGFLFGLVRGAFVVAVAFIVLTWVFPRMEDRPTWMAEARTLPILEQSASVVRALVPADLAAGEDSARAATQDAKGKADAAMQVKAAIDAAAKPTPSGITPSGTTPAPALTPPAANPATAPTAPTPPVAAQAAPGTTPPPPGQTPAYGNDERRGLDRLFESKQ